jgi:hypothetical protein
MRARKSPRPSGPLGGIEGLNMIKKIVILFISVVIISLLVLIIAGDAIYDAIFNVRMNIQINSLFKREKARTNKEINSEILPLIALLEWGDIEKNVDEFTKILNRRDSPEVIRVTLDILSTKKFTNYVHPSEQLVDFIDEYSKKHPDYEKAVYKDPLQKDKYILSFLIQERIKEKTQ